MIGGFPPSGNKQERTLLRLYKSLGENDKQTLVKFAEFLANSEISTDSDSQNQPLIELSTPQDIDRPDKESVISAIKRLTKTYPMIDKSTLLDKISSHMTDHLIKGKDAVLVIDDLEVLFKESYEKLKAH